MNQVKILKICAENVDFFENNRFDIDFTNNMQVTNHSSDDPYYKIISSVYLPKYIAFNGVNAAGKTTVLETIGFFLDFYFNDRGLNTRKNYSFLNKIFKSDQIKLTIHYVYNSSMYKIETTIKDKGIFLDNYDIDEQKYEIIDEKIHIKNLGNSIVKKRMYTDGYKFHISRTDLSNAQKLFLNSTNSIIKMLNHETKQVIMSKFNKQSFSYSMKLSNDVSGIIQNSGLAIIQYLDPSIKELRANKITTEDKRSNFDGLTYTIVFQNQKELEVTPLQLNLILSDGTKRGLSIMTDIKRVLKTGGYYLIDEIELSLNRSIIIDIIRLFESDETNPHHATLLFSTHYTELLDSFERNDQIVLIHKDANYKIKLTNYSDLDKKNQLKKSDSYFADTFELGTAISYTKYNNLRKMFIGEVQDEV